MGEPVEMPDPEMLEVRVAHLRKLARRVLDAAGCQVGGDHLIGPIVAAIQSECRDVRDRCAHLVIALQDRGVTMHDPQMPEDVDPLGVLAVNLHQHYIKHDGSIGVLLPDEED